MAPPRYIPKKNENICPHKNFHMNVCSSIIHNSQKAETIQHSSDKWINKIWYIHRILFKYKKKDTDTCYNVDKP